MADLPPIAGKPGKVPMWVWIVGGGVIVLLLLMQRGGGGGGGGDGTGLLAAEVSQRMAEERASVEARFAESRALLDESLAGQAEAQRAAQSETAGLLSDMAAVQTALVNETAAASERRTAGTLAALQAQYAALLAAMQAQIDKLASAPPAPGAPPTPPAGTPLGPRPSDSQITDWARGIGLASDWGYAFVGRFGILPRNIPELEAWRSQIAVLDSQGRWCLPGGCY